MIQKPREVREKSLTPKTVNFKDMGPTFPAKIPEIFARGRRICISILNIVPIESLEYVLPDEFGYFSVAK